ncbi:hypothetical protein M0805_008762 [Coniferiporia weirii]|nr:hypothetical protein M0805_008762 [Coniferiporia weirii]
MPQDAQGDALQLSADSGPSKHKAEHAHHTRRIFIGPMPHTTKRPEGGEEEQVSDFVAVHGLRIYLKQGGRVEDWTDAKAKEFKRRLKERILESAAWYAVSKSKKKKKTMFATEWSGDTFEVGNVVGVGVNMLATHEEDVHTPAPAVGASSGSFQSPSRTKSAVTVHWDDPAVAPSDSIRAISADSESLDASAKTPASFVTARSHLSAPSQMAPSRSSEETNETGTDAGGSSSSRAHLLRVSSLASPAKAPSVKAKPDPERQRGARGEEEATKKTGSALRSILSGPNKGKEKSREVRYVSPTTSADQSPAPPSDVLDRSPLEVEDSSAAAATKATQTDASLANAAVADPEDDSHEEGVVMRDRMLVRVFQCNHETIRSPFDEEECRTTRGLDSKEWDEFLLVWRKGQIEIYEDYRSFCKERYLRHKHLAFIIPLSPRTKLSLFSTTDFSFCLICPPTPTKQKEGKSHRSIFHRSSQGLNVFVLRPKSKSRAVDWIWNLWKELGGALPSSFEVSCPLVHSRVSIPIPDSGNGWKVLTRDYIIDQCSRALENSFAWRTVVQLPILNGRRLELCWRTNTKLDWVWLKDDVEGRKRDWEVLFGAALKYVGSHSILELHLAEHYPTRVVAKDGGHLEEPPAVEGYVHTTKRKTQVRVQYYLSTHDGYLCSILADKVVPPPTPTDLKNFSRSEDEFREDEQARLHTQIMNVRGFWDLRNVLTVRRASHVVSQTEGGNVQPREGEDEGGVPRLPGFQSGEYFEEHELQRTDSDIGDEGGEHGMAAATNKARLNLYRSFELVMKNGRVVQFETYSTKVAVEWVTHLRASIVYWTKRRRGDTASQMNIVQESLDGGRITVARQYNKGERKIAPLPPNPENASQYMNEFWHWCVLDGCRQVIKSGRMYIKTKSRGQYTHAHLILAKGCLIQFRVNNVTMHYHQIGRINLIDAYVCSGYYAALALPEEEYDPNAPALAKIFQDGLETRDIMEDTLFLLWYRPHRIYAKGDLNKVPVQAINAKHRMLICRARSKLERDAWCWALNCEVERLVRVARERERRMREQGMPV